MIGIADTINKKTMNETIFIQTSLENNRSFITNVALMVESPILTPNKHITNCIIPIHDSGVAIFLS